MSEASYPEYSVLMSVYRKDDPSFFDAAVASMEAQTIPFHDLVLVCDGPLNKKLDSQLDSLSLRLGTRLIIVRQSKNGGLGAALNVGLPHCLCNVVARMDSDDLSRPDRMEKLLSKMTAEHLDLVGGAIEEFDKQPGDMRSVRMPPLGRREISIRLKTRNPFNHMTVVFGKHAVEKVGGYEPFPWMEDYWLWARMIKDGCRCANIPDVVVDVRTGEGMYSRRSNVAYLKSQAKFFCALRKLGLINQADQVIAIVQRALVTVLPNSLVKRVYNGLLRQKAGV